MKKITAHLLIVLVSCSIWCLSGCFREDTSVVGGPCSSDADCGSNGLCIGEWPDGYCTKECSSDQDCGGDGWCYKLSGNQGEINLCLDGCANSDECRQGYTCEGDSGYMICYPESGGTSTIPGGTTTIALSDNQWTYMVYMGADNNLSQSGLQDINEMELVGSNDALSIVVQAEFSPKYTQGVPADTRRFLITNDNNPSSVNLEGTSIGNVDMGNPNTLKEFIQWAAKNYPAQHYALVIWDHGAGWKDGTQHVSNAVVKGAVQDETSNSFMSLPDIAAAVKNSGLHFDVINFDACLMAMYEVAYEFSGLADYMVFSEETEPGAGDPYDKILGELKNNPTMSAESLAKTIVDNYDQFYTGDAREKTTKSAIIMSQVTALHTKITGIANALMSDSSSTATVQAAQNNTKTYTIPANHDLWDMCNYLSTHLTSGEAKTLANEIKGLIDTMVINNKTNPDSEIGQNHGIAIYVPNADQTNTEDLAQYALLASNQSRSPASGTWGAYVEQLIAGLGGGTVQYGSGGFGLYLYWTDNNGNRCDADLDLYVWEPNAYYVNNPSADNGQWYAPWMGQTTLNGFFSQDSLDSGYPEEYYLANDQIYQGDYLFVVNYWLDGQCTSALAHVLVYLPGASDFMELTSANLGFQMQWPSPHLMDLSSPYPGTGCNDLLCFNNYSDWWIPDAYYTAKVREESKLAMILNRSAENKNDIMIFRYGKGFPLSVLRTN